MHDAFGRSLKMTVVEKDSAIKDKDEESSEEEESDEDDDEKKEDEPKSEGKKIETVMSYAWKRIYIKRIFSVAKKESNINFSHGIPHIRF